MSHSYELSRALREMPYSLTGSEVCSCAVDLWHRFFGCVRCLKWVRSTFKILKIGVESSLKVKKKAGSAKWPNLLTKPYFSLSGFLFWIVTLFVVKWLIRYFADFCKISAAEVQALQANCKIVKWSVPVPAAEFSHAWLTFRPNNVPESIFRCSWCFETHDNLMLTVTCYCLLQVAVENQVRTLRHRWELVKRGDLLGFLAAPTGVEMSPQLEASVAEMACCLKSLFSVLFCTSQGEPFISQQLLATISQIKELLQTRLADYEDYLLVKGRRNMTMTAYPFATSSNAQSRFLSFGLQASNLSCGQ